MGLEPGEEIYEVEKVYFADGHPAIISVDCFACDLIGIDLTCEFMAGRSIFEVLHQYGGCFIARDKISMETMNRAEMEKSVVSGKEMECDSVLVFRGKNYNQENKLVMLDQGVLRYKVYSIQSFTCKECRQCTRLTVFPLVHRR